MNAPVDDLGESAARRTLLLLVAAVAMALGAGIVLVVGGEDATVTDPASVVGVTVTEIGPGEGTSVSSYAATRRDALRAAEGERLAIVSFDAYVAVAAVEDRLGDDVVPQALMVVLPGGAATTTTDPAAARSDVVADAELQIAEISALLPTVEDDEFDDFYRAELDRYALIVASADRADVVFAAVVRATAAELRALASRPGIRMVDIAAGTELEPEARLRGLRPEETTTVGTPEFRPAP